MTCADCRRALDARAPGWVWLLSLGAVCMGCYYARFGR